MTCQVMGYVLSGKNTQRDNSMEPMRQLQPQKTNRRNPYLQTYEEDRRQLRQGGAGRGTTRRSEQEQRSVRMEQGNAGRGNAKRSGVRQSAPKQSAAYKRKTKKYRRLRQRRLRRMVAACMVLFLVGAMKCAAGIHKAAADTDAELPKPFFTPIEEKVQGISKKLYDKHPVWTEDFLTPNEYSRPGEALEEVNSIFVHYTANQNTSAAQNRSYFEQLKDTHERSASAHFIIGYQGEIIQCIPLDEIAYAVKTRNYDSISIECCYTADNGSFTQETYDSLLGLLGWLTEAYSLKQEDILRHYDCGGKKCPLYYTEHEDAWEQLKKDVTAWYGIK